MNLRKLVGVYLAALATQFVLATNANAYAVCQFGTVSGGTCTVTGANFNVSYQVADVGLYGGARVLGNNVFFQPSNFGATSVDGAGTGSIQDTITFDIEVTNTDLTAGITELNFTERGRYQTIGAGASVNYDATATVTDFDSFVFYDSVALDPAAPFGNTGGNSANWASSADTSSMTEFGSPTSFAASRNLSVSFQNTLTAFTTSAGEFATIEKTQGGITNPMIEIGVIGLPPAPVPVPAAAWLFGTAIAGLMARKRFK